MVKCIVCGEEITTVMCMCGACGKKECQETVHNREKWIEFCQKKEKV